MIVSWICEAKPLVITYIKYFNIYNYDITYGSTKNNIGIPGSFNSGMKINMKMLFAVFIYQLKQYFMYTSGKAVNCETLESEHSL